MAKNKYDKFGRIQATDTQTGEEVFFSECSSVEEQEKMIPRMLNLYNYYLDFSDLQKELLKWMKNTKKFSDKMPAIKNGKNGYISICGKIARAMNTGLNESIGMPIMERYMKYIQTENSVQTEKTEKNMEQKKNTQNPQELLEDKVGRTILVELEKFLDEELMKTETKITPLNLYSLLKEHGTPRNGLRYVHNWLDNQIVDYYSALDEIDPDMVEGYSYLSKPAKKNRIATLEKLQIDVTKYQATFEKVTRTKKKQTPEKIVSKVKFCESVSDLNLKSQSPTSCLGATEVILYNQKYSTVSYVKAFDKDGLSFKGMSFVDYNPEYSFTIKLRKPKEFPFDSKIADMKKALKNLTTKTQPFNGRINENILIVSTK